MRKALGHPTLHPVIPCLGWGEKTAGGRGGFAVLSWKEAVMIWVVGSLPGSLSFRWQSSFIEGSLPLTQRRRGLGTCLWLQLHLDGRLPAAPRERLPAGQSQALPTLPASLCALFLTGCLLDLCQALPLLIHNLGLKGFPSLYHPLPSLPSTSAHWVLCTFCQMLYWALRPCKALTLGWFPGLIPDNSTAPLLAMFLDHGTHGPSTGSFWPSLWKGWPSSPEGGCFVLRGFRCLSPHRMAYTAQRGRLFLYRLCRCPASLLLKNWNVLWTEVFAPHPKLTGWNPNPQCDGTRRWGPWAVTRLWGSSPPEWDQRPLLQREDTSERQVSVNQTPNLPEPWCWTFQSLELWERNVRYFGHQAYGIFIKQPEWTMAGWLTWRKNFVFPLKYHTPPFYFIPPDITLIQGLGISCPHHSSSLLAELLETSEILTT